MDYLPPDKAGDPASGIVWGVGRGGKGEILRDGPAFPRNGPCGEGGISPLDERELSRILESTPVEKKYVILISVLVILGLCLLGLWSGATSLESVAKERAAKAGYQAAKREEGALLETIRREFPKDWAVESVAGDPSIDHLKGGVFECSRSRRFVASRLIPSDESQATVTRLEALPALKKWTDRAGEKKEKRSYQFQSSTSDDGKSVVEATLSAATDPKPQTP
ncbi:MAG: hypothetical protein JWO82_1448 [Akkermansiaceae bacterium]|nr:hypothetical protein [Akkermansiaceae bacterium]